VLGEERERAGDAFGRSPQALALRLGFEARAERTHVTLDVAAP
jgi:hypothetical protein